MKAQQIHSRSPRLRGIGEKRDSGQSRSTPGAVLVKIERDSEPINFPLLIAPSPDKAELRVLAPIGRSVC